MSLDLILPALVAEVFRARYDGIDIEPTPPRAGILPPQARPAIRLRGRGQANARGGVLVSRLLVVTFSDSAPLALSPLDLVDDVSGFVLPELMTALPGVELKLRQHRATRVQSGGGLSVAVHHWSASASLAG
ncbi:hypothetical protein [Micromonospora coerulea]|uniref:hypothetical protein n=1 Tax=Micromonospora coerulea TaxID=47856 RepID=UPI0019077032|nr:hypothetical protein [Micromonospora veneta]